MLCSFSRNSIFQFLISFFRVETKITRPIGEIIKNLQIFFGWITFLYQSYVFVLVIFSKIVLFDFYGYFSWLKSIHFMAFYKWSENYLSYQKVNFTKFVDLFLVHQFSSNIFSHCLHSLTKNESFYFSLFFVRPKFEFSFFR